LTALLARLVQPAGTIYYVPLGPPDSVPNLTPRMDARLRARPQLADEIQQIMARIEPETKNQVRHPETNELTGIRLRIKRRKR